jgi:hypothetical protein
VSNQHSDSDNHQHRESWLFSRTGVVTVCALAILGFLVYTGHSAHLLGLVPYLFILACPLMHVFMHGGRHHHAAKDDGKSESHEHGGGCCGDSDHENHGNHDMKTDKRPSSNSGLGE